MPLPIATIGLSLAAAGLKIFGGESKLLEFAAHPLDVAAGHLGAETILELAERLRTWYAGNERIENEDLERAVARSALLADWFCLLDALPPQAGGFGPWSQLRVRFQKWLPADSFQGAISQGEESAIRPAMEAREKRLKEIEEGTFVPAGIDSLRLILPERAGDWGANLASEALADIQREHANLPERLRSIFEVRWFPYLCLAFQEEIKTNARVRGIFSAMQIATGFDRMERLIREIGPRTVAAPVDPYASVRAVVPNYVERIALQDRLRELLLGAGQTVALTALQGMGGIGKTELARKLCHDPKVREAFPDGIVWLDIGRESGKTVLDRMQEVAEKLNDDKALYTAGNCETRYRSLLAGKAVLVVLDDVWGEADVRPFIPDSPHCRVLFTTRDTRIAAETGAVDCMADLLSAEQAWTVLAKYAGLDRDRLPLEAAGIIAECGWLPQGLAVVGAALRGKPPMRWADILEELRHAEVSKLLAPTAVSVDAMGRENPTVRDRYLQLAVLLEDMAAAEPVLRTLWGVDARAVRDTLDDLENRSLARREDGGLRIHDLQMDYVRSVYPHRDALPLIHQALRLSSHVVARDAAQFASQMLGRMLAYAEDAGIREFVERISGSAPRPWLRPLLPALTPPGTGLIRTLEGNTGPVWGVAISTDGKVAVSAGDDGTVTVWHVEMGRECHKLRNITGPIWAVAMSADGKVAISAPWSEPLKVWDVESGRERCTLRGHTLPVSGVAMSWDGKLALSASFDCTLKVWDVEGGRERRTLDGHAAPVRGCSMSADGKVAISASWDGTLKVWDAESGRERRTLDGHDNQVRGVAVSADGKVAVSASEDRTLKVWDVESGRELRALRGHTEEVNGVAVSADGKIAVSASSDQTVRVWDVESGRERRTFQGHTERVFGVTVKADGKVAVSASEDRTLKVWDVESGRELPTLHGHTGEVNDVAVSANGKIAVSASADRTVKVWDAEMGRELRTLGGTDPVRGVAVSADGKVAVSASHDKALKVWSVESGQELRTLQGHSDLVWGVAVSANGKVAVSASRDEMLKVWDVESGRERRTFPLRSRIVRGLAVSADGRVAVLASYYYGTQVWDVESGRELGMLGDLADTVWGVAVRADGKLAVSASDDWTLKVWDVDSRRMLRTLRGHSGRIRGVSVRADGKTAASASEDRSLKVWDVESGTCLATFSCDAPLHCCAIAAGVIVAGDLSGRVYFLALEQ